MIISFANEKGGVGKTTLSIAFANYLALELKKEVIACDSDIQQSFYDRYNSDEENSLPTLYDIEVFNEIKNTKYLNDDKFLLSMFNSSSICIFDTSGARKNIYSKLFYYSNYIIVPFEYSNFDITATLKFLFVIKKEIKSDAKIFFIKNNMRKDENYPLKKIDNELNKIGTIINEPIYKRKSLLQISTRKLTVEQKLAVKLCFQEIIYNIWEIY